MKFSLLISALLLTICFSLNAKAQPAFPEATKEHQWLKKFVGQWEVKGKGMMGENQPSLESTGSISSVMLGDFWVINTMDGNVGGVKYRGIQTIGYDTKKGKYIGTWIDSTNDYAWRYEGSVDDSGNKITLEATGPHMMQPGQTAEYRDAYEFHDDNTMTATSSIKGEDGKWRTFMVSEAKRKK